MIFNETLNNDVTVYWGYSKPHRVLIGLTVLVKYVSRWYIWKIQYKYIVVL